MPSSGRVGGFKIPPVDGKIGISTSNYEPVDGAGGNESTDFTSEFLERCHGLCSNSGSCLRTLPNTVFLYAELLDFRIKRRPWNSKLDGCTIWPDNFPLTFRGWGPRKRRNRVHQDTKRPMVGGAVRNHTLQKSS